MVLSKGNVGERAGENAMPVVEALQTFVGIANENEFYSHHYLAAVRSRSGATLHHPGGPPRVAAQFISVCRRSKWSEIPI
jgi:hypothetical protein